MVEVARSAGFNHYSLSYPHRLLIIQVDGLLLVADSGLMQKQKISSYRDLFVWQKAMDLTTNIYQLTAQLPPEERYGISSQMRRAAVSIPSNIAEGSYRGTRKDYRNFILVAYGSGAELETQLEILNRLGLVARGNIVTAQHLLNSVMRMLNNLAKELAT